MSKTTIFLMSILSVCFMTIGAIFLWTQNTKRKNNLELPSISQQSETNEKTSQNEQLNVETPKKRPLLIKKASRQPVDTSQNEPSRVEMPKKRPLLIKKHTQQHVIPPIPDFPVLPDMSAFLVPMRVNITLAGIMRKYKQGEIDLEYVVDYFESQHHFDPAILDELEPRRAFKYFNRIVGVSSDTVKAYAERILAKDPDNPDAQLHMVRYEKDETKIIQRYKQILTQHPDHPDTLSALGSRLLDDFPEEALQYLKKANRLDPTIALFVLGLVYEKIGDFKSAWFCYKKSILIRNRENLRKEKFPPSRICVHYATFGDVSNLYAIEGGKYWKSAIKMVPDPNENTIRRVVTFQSVDAQQEREIREFYQFRDWVQNIENMHKLNQNNDFLIIEVKRHLNGGKPMFDPERIVRAYEITTRYPGNEGIQRLKKTDIEIALEIERLLQEEKEN